MENKLELSSTLIIKGVVDDFVLVRVFRVYKGHYIWYSEMPTEGGIDRNSEILNAEQLEVRLQEAYTEGIISGEIIGDFLKH